MTEFVTPSPRVDGFPVYDDNWNQDVVYNTIALHERLPTLYPHLQVANTLADTELFSKIIPANSLGAKGFIMLECAGTCRNNYGSAVTFVFRSYLGATTIFAYTVSIPDAGGTYRTPIQLTLCIQNIGATNSQLCTLHSRRTTSPITSPTPGAETLETGWTSTPVDTTAQVTAKLELEMTVAHSSVIFDLMCAKVVGPIYKE